MSAVGIAHDPSEPDTKSAQSSVGSKATEPKTKASTDTEQAIIDETRHRIAPPPLKDDPALERDTFRRYVEGKLFARGFGTSSMRNWHFNFGKSGEDQPQRFSMRNLSEDPMADRAAGARDALRRFEDGLFDRSMQVAVVGDDETMAGSLPGMPLRNTTPSLIDVFNPLEFGASFDRASRGIEYVGGRSGSSNGGSGSGSFHFGSASAPSSSGGGGGGGRSSSSGGGGGSASGGGQSQPTSQGTPAAAGNPSEPPAASTGGEPPSTPTSGGVGTTSGGGTPPTQGPMPDPNAPPVSSGGGSSSNGSGSGSGSGGVGTTGGGSGSGGSSGSGGVGTTGGGSSGSGSQGSGTGSGSGGSGSGSGSTGGGVPASNPIPPGGNGNGSGSGSGSGGGSGSGSGSSGGGSGSGGGSSSGGGSGSGSSGSSTGNFDVLVAGDGFNGPTAQPGQVGSITTPGWDAKAIARWDVVPFQTIDEEFHVGVIAFHINGIDYVEFSLDGGPWVKTHEMEHNPRTDVWEYTVTIDPSAMNDGLHEIRARVIPENAGTARVLGGEINEATIYSGEHSLVISSNAGKSLPDVHIVISPDGDDLTGDGSLNRPFRTLSKGIAAGQSRTGTNTADGVTVELQAGEYSWGPAQVDQAGTYLGKVFTTSRYVTVRPATGVSRDEVLFTSSETGGTKTAHIRVENITWETKILQSKDDSFLWLDECLLQGEGTTVKQHWIGSTWWTGHYVTNTEISNTRFGLTGSPTLVRNVYAHDIGDDAFTNPITLVNCLAERVQTPPGSGFHSDVVQYHGGGLVNNPVPAPNNRIVYGLEAYDCISQGWHMAYTMHIAGDDWNDIAIVNMILDVTGPTHQWRARTNHLLMWHMTITGGAVVVQDDANHPIITKNFSMMNNSLYELRILNNNAMPLADNNHFINTTTYGATSVGTNATIGSNLFELYKDSGANDFRARVGSMLTNRPEFTRVVNNDVFGLALDPQESASGAAQSANASSGQ